MGGSWLLVVTWGCVPDLAPQGMPSNPNHDFDGDGWVESPTATNGGDCNDEDASVYPGAVEICDEIDQDCNGRVDEEALDSVEFYRDFDDDGFGSQDDPVLACTQEEGYAANALDCDDADAFVYPEAEEVCEDGIDNDCDGWASCELEDEVVLLQGVDEEDRAGTAVVGQLDLDGDGADDLVLGAPLSDGDSTINSTNYGAVYVVWGKVDKTILDRSIASLKAHHPDLPVHIEHLPDEATLLDKARLLDFTPFEETLFLDMDTVVMGNLDFGFRKGREVGLALCICECPWARRYGGLAGDVVEYNTGVMFFTKRPGPSSRPGRTSSAISIRASSSRLGATT